MQAFNHPNEMIRAADLRGPADLYAALLTVKNGFGNGSILGCYCITKAQAKAAGIEWQFVVDSCNVLNLNLSNRAGRRGHSIDNLG
jgi:hypothetical protein